MELETYPELVSNRRTKSGIQCSESESGITEDEMDVPKGAQGWNEPESCSRGPKFCEQCRDNAQEEESAETGIHDMDVDMNDSGVARR